MSRNRAYILIIIMSAVLVFFVLPNATSSDPFAKCTACSPRQSDELKRAGFHVSMECTDCHKLGSFGDDLRSHDATTPACAGCHEGLHGITY